MSLFDISHGGEAISYILGFWLFIFSPSFRCRRMEQWQTAGFGGKLVWFVESAFATVLGLLPFMLAGYLLFG